ISEASSGLTFRFAGSLLGGAHPAIGILKQDRQLQHLMRGEAIGGVPRIALFVTAAGDSAVAGALVAGVFPDGDADGAFPEGLGGLLLGGFAGHGRSLSAVGSAS